MNASTRRMVFVTGASRSGTTLTAQLLGRHSQIAKLKEMQYFGEFWDPRREDAPLTANRTRRALELLFDRQERGIVAADGTGNSGAAHGFLQTLDPGVTPSELFAATAAHFAEGEGKTIPCEQTPRNIFYAAALLKRYPQARVVHLLRDPRGVMASQKYRWRLHSSDNGSSATLRQRLRTRVNYHPYTVTELWNRATEAALRLSEHPRFMLVKFEELIEDPESVLRRISEFVGVTFEPEMLQASHVNSSHVRRRSEDGSSRAVFDRGTIDRWRTTLSTDELAIVASKCGTLMRAASYPTEKVELSTTGRLIYPPLYALHLAGAALINPQRLWIQARAMLARGSAASDPRDGAHSDAATDPESGDRSLIFGLPCIDVTIDQAAEDLVSFAANGERKNVMFVNAHSLNVSVHSPELQHALLGADAIYADGVGMALAARAHGGRLLHNVNGTDLFPQLCQVAAKRGVPIALFGAAPGVVDRCVNRLRSDFPALRVAWHHHGFPAPGRMDDLIQDINNSGAGILLVAMGVPRQELWMDEHAEALSVPVVLGVGGLFDFVSGRVPRAPEGIRRLRMEWLYRLMIEPRRLFSRYVIGVPVFLVRTVKYAATGRVWRGISGN